MIKGGSCKLTKLAHLDTGHIGPLLSGQLFGRRCILGHLSFGRLDLLADLLRVRVDIDWRLSRERSPLPDLLPMFVFQKVRVVSGKAGMGTHLDVGVTQEHCLLVDLFDNEVLNAEPALVVGIRARRRMIVDVGLPY